MKYAVAMFLALVAHPVTPASLSRDRHGLPMRLIDGDAYSATPAGWVLSHCVTEVPADPTKAGRASAKQCSPLVNSLNPVIRDNAAIKQQEGDAPPLPADYDGWTQYTATNTDPAGYSSFTGLMSVPDIPKELPQILYLFPGLQNYDWIPRVDPLPTSATPFDIIQPVLQYPGESEGTWGVRSWYVTVNTGAKMSEMISIKPGDSVNCSMIKLGEIDWLIGSQVQSSGRTTNQRVNRFTPGASDRLKSQPWAYNTVECYGCNGCGTYPTTPVTFSDLKLTASNGTVVTPTWAANPKPSKRMQCRESTKINGPDNVVISFQ